MIKDDRRYFRKKYGVQFLLDVIRQYYAACELLSSDDSKTIRMSLLSLVKYYMQKELNAKEVAAILGFLSSVKEEVLVSKLVFVCCVATKYESFLCLEVSLLLPRGFSSLGINHII